MPDSEFTEPSLSKAVDANSAAETSENWRLVQAKDNFQLSNSQGSNPCLVGSSGLIEAANKREGDGATPRGRWPLSAVYYRADRVNKPNSMLPEFALTPACGWCDDPASPLYNQYVTLPQSASCERLYRHDSSYDIIVTIDFNHSPVVAGKGSAIFMHCIASGKADTTGSVALAPHVLWQLLQEASSNTCLVV